MNRKDWRENKKRPEPKPVAEKKVKKKSSKIGTRNRNPRVGLTQAAYDWQSAVNAQD